MLSGLIILEPNYVGIRISFKADQNITTMKKLLLTFLLLAVTGAMFAQSTARVRSEDTNNPEIDNLSGLKPDESELIESGMVGGFTQSDNGATTEVSSHSDTPSKNIENPDMAGDKSNILESTNVYPNPATNYLTISSDATSGTIVILNLLGQVMSTHNITGTLTSIDIEALGEGIYFVSIESGSAKIVKKIKVLY